VSGRPDRAGLGQWLDVPGRSALRRGRGTYQPAPAKPTATP